MNLPFSFRSIPIGPAGGVLLVGWFLWATTNCLAQEDDPLLDRAISAAVDYVTPNLIRLDPIGGVDQVEGETIASGPGTALVISRDGYALTASFHLAGEPASLLATLPNGDQCAAEVVSRDRSRNLTLIKLQTRQEFDPPRLAARNKLRVGQSVVAVGRGLDRQRPHLSAGILSATNRIWGKAVQTDANVSPSNYGGPLIDLQGRVIGMLVPLDLKDARPLAGLDWYDSGIGFAVPLDPVLKRIDQLKNGTDLKPGLLGADMKTGDRLVDPATIGYCRGTSPAAIAGLRPGDTIVQINSLPIRRLLDFEREIGHRYAGEQLELSIQRGSQRMTTQVKLASQMPAFEPVGFDFRVEQNDLGNGVVVKALQPEGPAAKAGLRSGDLISVINGQPIQTKSQLRMAIASVSAGATTTLKINRSGQALTLSPTGVRRSALVPPESSSAASNAKISSQKIRIPDEPNRCRAWFQTRPTRSSPLLVWLANPGEELDENIEKQLIDACRVDQVAMLVVFPGNLAGWQDDESDAVIKAISTFTREFPNDMQRVVIGGQGPAGTLASRIAFNTPRLFQGLILDGASISRRIESIQASPLAPQMVLTVGSAQAMDSAIKRLQEGKIPIASVERLNGIRLGRWAAWVDRF